MLSEHLERFSVWLERNRDISPGSIRGHIRLIATALSALGDDPRAYDAALIRQVLFEAIEHRSRNYARKLTIAMRIYLRFLVSEGSIAAALIAAVPTVPRWRLSTLPRYIPADDVERTIASCSDDPVGVRDRAILLLLARLALRAGDIVALRLGDIDWDRAEIQVAGKSRWQTVRLCPRMPATRSTPISRRCGRRWAKRRCSSARGRPKGRFLAPVPPPQLRGSRWIAPGSPPSPPAALMCSGTARRQSCSDPVQHSTSAEGGDGRALPAASDSPAAGGGAGRRGGRGCVFPGGGHAVRGPGPRPGAGRAGAADRDLRTGGRSWGFGGRVRAPGRRSSQAGGEARGGRAAGGPPCQAVVLAGVDASPGFRRRAIRARCCSASPARPGPRRHPVRGQAPRSPSTSPAAP